MPVGQKSKAGGPYEIFDMIGNLGERVQDCPHSMLPSQGPTAGRPSLNG